MFENLSERLGHAFKTLRGQGRITERNVSDTIKDIRRALLDADVSYPVARDFCNQVKEKAMGMEVPSAVNPGQLMVKLVHDELAAFMGGGAQDIRLEGNPSVVLVAGLNGSGKTTFCAKLAQRLRTRLGQRVMLCACDTFRPAAVEQLQTLAAQIDVPVFALPEEKDPLRIAAQGVQAAVREGCQTLIVDTAGRLAVDEPLMAEIASLKGALHPSETLFVVDAMMGQDAVQTARTFHDRLDFDGVVLSKMDADTRGGAALSVKAVVGKPIKFVSSGEKLDTLDVFHPDRIADRILGMGDVVSLVEKAQEQFDEKRSREIRKKLAKNQFTLQDFYSQIQQVKKMGNMKELLGMVPGMSKALKGVDIPDDAFQRTEAIILSMTPLERERPELLNASRRSRVAKGSGTSLQEVNRLLRQFEDMRKLMKSSLASRMAGRMMGGRRGF